MEEIMDWKYQLFFLSALFFVTTAAWTQDKGGRWQFEDNGFDTADWDNLEDSGTLQGTATYNSEDPAEGISYLWLDTLSVNDYVRIDDSDDLDFTDEDIGVSMWIYPVLINDVHYLINKGDQFSEPITTNYSLRISNKGLLEFLVRDSTKAQKVTSSFSIPVNQWSFVAVFYDYNASKVYMWNSVIATPIDTLAFNFHFFSNNDPLSIGSWYRSDPENPSTKDFNGRVDDVRISGSIENIITVTSGIEQMERLSEFKLKQNYPNPFNPKTIINYELPMTNFVDLSIYNSLGEKVATLVNKNQNSGIYQVEWDAGYLSSGIYYFMIRAGEFQSAKKMMLIK
jgi:hypothetical protein